MKGINLGIIGQLIGVCKLVTFTFMDCGLAPILLSMMLIFSSTGKIWYESLIIVKEIK